MLHKLILGAERRNVTPQTSAQFRYFPVRQKNIVIVETKTKTGARDVKTLTLFRVSMISEATTSCEQIIGFMSCLLILMIQ